MGYRRPHSVEWWQDEAQYIISIITPGSRFNWDWDCVQRYVEMQDQSCRADLGKSHKFSIMIGLKLKSLQSGGK